MGNRWLKTSVPLRHTVEKYSWDSNTLKVFNTLVLATGRRFVSDSHREPEEHQKSARPEVDTSTSAEEHLQEGTGRIASVTHHCIGLYISTLAHRIAFTNSSVNV